MRKWNDGLDDDSDQEQTVTHTAARHAVQVLVQERYFMEQEFSETLAAALDACFDTVRRKASASTKQTNLDRFFS